MDDLKSYRRKNSLRYKGFDYSNAGYYFVTVCTQNSKYTLSHIISHGENAAVKLTEVGEIVNDVWNTLPQHYDKVKTEDFVIMPNHIHGIIVIENGSSKNLSDIIKLFKQITTKKCREKFGSNFELWQRSFYDEIMESEEHYYNVKWYITCNPRNWKTDKYR